MKNFYKKLIALLLSLIFVLSLASCGAKEPSSSSSGAEKTRLKVGASPSPHAQILEQVKPLLAEKGIELEIVEFTDYILPNRALDAGDIDANYFQHEPYLTNFNAENKTNLAVAGNIHYELMGIYGGKSSDLATIGEGAQIAVPNDPTNEARALLLLEANGLIKLASGKGLSATVNDITENSHNIKFVEIEAAQLPRTLGDVDFAVINGNYALDAGLLDKLIVTEKDDAEGAQKYVNIVAVKAGNEGSVAVKALVEALSSDTVANYVQQKYGSIVKMA